MQIVVRLQIERAVERDDVDGFVECHVDPMVRDLVASWVVERVSVEVTDDDLAPAGWEAVL